jgi:hypothetical protein
LSVINVFPVYFIKWQFMTSKANRLRLLTIFVITLIGSLLYLLNISERFGIESSKILSIGLKRMFLPNDIYLDLHKLPSSMIFNENISPLVFLEPFTKIFYDETPLGTIGSILREGSSQPKIVTGGTPYISIHLAFLQYSWIAVAVGILFLIFTFSLMCLIANNLFKLPVQISWITLGLPAIYINDYSALAMRLFHLALLFIFFHMFKCYPPKKKKIFRQTKIKRESLDKHMTCN